MENKLTTDVIIDVTPAAGTANTNPLHGKVFPVERLTPTQAKAMAAKGVGLRELGKNVYVINKPLNDCRYKGVYIAHIETGGNQVFYLWCDAGRYREPLQIWSWQDPAGLWRGDDGMRKSCIEQDVYHYVCRVVRRRHKMGKSFYWPPQGEMSCTPSGRIPSKSKGLATAPVMRHWTQEEWAEAKAMRTVDYIRKSAHRRVAEGGGDPQSAVDWDTSPTGLN